MLEQNKPADELLEAIKQVVERSSGETPTPKELLDKATKVLKERLGL